MHHRNHLAFVVVTIIDDIIDANPMTIALGSIKSLLRTLQLSFQTSYLLLDRQLQPRQYSADPRGRQGCQQHEYQKRFHCLPQSMSLCLVFTTHESNSTGSRRSNGRPRFPTRSSTQHGCRQRVNGALAAAPSFHHPRSYSESDQGIALWRANINFHRSIYLEGCRLPLYPEQVVASVFLAMSFLLIQIRCVARITSRQTTGNSCSPPSHAHITTPSANLLLSTTSIIGPPDARRTRVPMGMGWPICWSLRAPRRTPWRR